jgi:threonine dehydrogenase-like Zn-dependent dehydrogenase
MRGLWLQDGALRLRDDIPLPEAGPGDAVVRVLVAGICGTDLELVKGYYPFAGVPGHEFVGVVEAASGAADWVGRRVVGEINVACRRCPTCEAGRQAHCPRRTVIGIRDRPGAFAERLAVPVVNLHEVPAGVDDETAVFTEPLAAALEIGQQVPLAGVRRAVVLGDGRLGLLVGQALAAAGLSPMLAGRTAARADLARRLSLAHVLVEALPEHEADLVVECTGNPEGLPAALRAVRPRGTVVLKSTYRGDARVNLSAAGVDEVTLVGSRCGPFAPALDLLARGRVQVQPLVDAQRPLAEGEQAFTQAARAGTLKVLLRP